MVSSDDFTAEITDTETQIGAQVDDYGVDTVDSDGGTPPAGDVFFFAEAIENNNSSEEFTSSPSNFTLIGSDGHLYRAIGGTPDYEIVQAATPTILEPGDSSDGWIEFEVPVGTYEIAWNEGGVIPYWPMGSVQVDPNLYPSDQPLAHASVLK